jgi:hypothetical protein
MNVQQLAVIMNMPESDVQAFVNCLRVWTDKGHGIEAAIAKHSEQMMRLACNSHVLPKSIVIDTFFPE